MEHQLHLLRVLMEHQLPPLKVLTAPLLRAPTVLLKVQPVPAPTTELLPTITKLPTPTMALPKKRPMTNLTTAPPPTTTVRLLPPKLAMALPMPKLLPTMVLQLPKLPLKATALLLLNPAPCTEPLLPPAMEPPVQPLLVITQPQLLVALEDRETEENSTETTTTATTREETTSGADDKLPKPNKQTRIAFFAMIANNCVPIIALVLFSHQSQSQYLYCY
jgi:hypothetical protein